VPTSYDNYAAIASVISFRTIGRIVIMTFENRSIADIRTPERRSLAYGGGIFSFTRERTPLLSDEPLHQFRKLQQVCDP
jgi:hypothetical protein